MNLLILSLIKYTAIFICITYCYIKLLRIKPKAWDVFAVPLFVVLSAVLYFVTVYVKILVPVGLLFFGALFLLIRFKQKLYITLTVSAIALGITIFAMLISFIFSFPIASVLYFVENETAKSILMQLSISLTNIIAIVLLFRIKRLKSGIKPDKNDATFDILLYISVFNIFTLMLIYRKDITYSFHETALLIITLFGLLLIVWWRKHITFIYRDNVNKQTVRRMEDTIEEFKLNSAENDLQIAVYAKLFHYLNKAVPDCALLSESAAENTACDDVLALRDMLRRILSEMNLANEKCSFKNVPLTGVRAIDVPLIRLFTAAERKSFNASADISADADGWFTENKLSKDDIHILLSYLLDNAVISALGAPNAKVRVELGETAGKKPLIRIYDSGEQFDESVLLRLGLEQVTTRAGDGGNGIGLLTVFEILAKYGASFTLDEAPERFGFTKFIEIAFDGRNSVSVRTSRESAITVCAARKGITVERVSLDSEALRDGTNG